MKSFCRYVEVEKRMMKFNFTYVQLPNGNKFFVAVFDNQELEVNFEMRLEKEHNWIILPPAPDWIISCEKKLSILINEQILL